MPVSMKRIVSIRRLGRSMSLLTGNAIGSKCGCNNAKSLGESAARSLFRNRAELRAETVAMALFPVWRARAHQGLSNARARGRCERHTDHKLGRAVCPSDNNSGLVISKMYGTVPLTSLLAVKALRVGPRARSIDE